jgi:hypothetical protein
VGRTSLIKALCLSGDKENGNLGALNTTANALTTFDFKNNCAIKFEFVTHKTTISARVYGIIILYDLTNYESFLRVK